ncbi:MAG: HAD family hydrolase [Bacteroidales bacterium]|nr:HAD family hydrolase [Bacteroidales bacterium]
MTKLIIFDFDGTLADTRELIVRTNQEAMRRLRYPVASEAAIVATIGLPLKESILALFPDLPEEEIPVWIRVYREVFESLKSQIVPVLFPHVRETLSLLHSRGLILSVASSRGTESLNGFLKDMGIAPYISYVLGADDVAHPKPHPEPVLKTLNDLSVNASEALVVGDMPVDIQMGLGAGAHTCGVTLGNSDRAALLASGAHFVIDGFEELPGIIK